MSQTTPNKLPDWIRYFKVLDSTNNYATQLIKDGLAQHGSAVWATQQIKGKGQRGNTWQDNPENLKFSLIVQPPPSLLHPFHLSILVSVILVNYLKTILPEKCNVSVKWPNDIYLNDKKTCGILIENTFLGHHWSFATIGIGLNVNQERFPDTLKKATSLFEASGGKRFDLLKIITDIRAFILKELNAQNNNSCESLLSQYNNVLFLREKTILFRERKNNFVFSAKVLKVNTDGHLALLLSSGIQNYEFGSIEWLL